MMANMTLNAMGKAVSVDGWAYRAGSGLEGTGYLTLYVDDVAVQLMGVTPQELWAMASAIGRVASEMVAGCRQAIDDQMAADDETDVSNVEDPGQEPEHVEGVSHGG